MNRVRAIRWFFAILAGASLLAGHPASAVSLCDTTDPLPVGGLVRTVDATTGALNVEVCDWVALPETRVVPDVTVAPTTTPRPSDRPVPAPGGNDASASPIRPARSDGASSVPAHARTQTPAAPAERTPPAQQRITLAASVFPVGMVAVVVVVALIAAGIGLGIGRRHGRRAGLGEAGELLDALSDGIVVCDEGGTVLACNATAAKIMGERADAARGRPLGELLAGKDDTGADLATRALAATTAVDVEATVGGTIPVRVAIAPVRDGRRRIGHALVLRDLSEQRRLERMKAEILANVGHELRSPLTSALGFARLVQSRDLSREKAQAFVGAIVDACEKLERVIDLLIDVAIVEGGQMPAETTPIDLERLLRAKMRAWQARAPRHVFTLAAPRGLGRVVGNRALLQHAVDELLDNAVKFSPDAGPVAIAATPRGDEVEITVVDHGIGIAPDHVDALFEDFAQGDGSPTRRFGGLGLGLGLVRRVARAHGGSVSVSSEPGAGTTVRLRLPMVRTHRAMPPSDVQPRTSAYARASAGS